MKRVALSIAFASLAASPAIAGHNNPWATSTDTILSQYHEDNLEQSVGTPGEDEMLGNMNQSVSSNAGGGFGGEAPADGSGHGGGGGQGAGGKS